MKHNEEGVRINKAASTQYDGNFQEKAFRHHKNKTLLASVREGVGGGWRASNSDNFSNKQPDLANEIEKLVLKDRNRGVKLM